MFTDTTGEYIHGLKKEMTGDKLMKLINKNKSDNIIAFNPLASNKRNRIREEQRCIQKQGKEINWNATLNQIKKFAQNNRYTISMTREMIIDLAKEELPDYDMYFQTLDINELSTHLIGRDPIMYKEEQFIKPLKNLIRQPGVSLNACTQNAQELYKLAKNIPNASYSENDEQFDQSYLQFSIDTLVKLSTPKVAAKIREWIHICKNRGKPFLYTDLLAGAIQLEAENMECRPTQPIKLDYLTEQELSVKLNNLKIRTHQKQMKFAEDSDF